MKKRVVIKIGTSLLTSKEGKLRIPFVGKICENIAEIQNAGWEVILVSSGAMATGTGILKSTPHSITERSVFAAVGQPFLIHYYADFMGHYDIHVAQCLLTWNDFCHETTKSLMKSNIEKMLENNILPIVNENDIVATEEITFGDNDSLASKIAVFFAADKLLILSDVDGLYSDNPQTNPKSEHIDEVKSFSDEIFGFVGEKTSKNSLGGMESKLKSTQYAVENGVETVIFQGHQNPEGMREILIENKKIGTVFRATK